MKKPISNYVIKYPKDIKSIYYGNCESGNNSCDTCNTGSNNTGSENGSGNSGSVSGWGN